ncbi:MAG: DNA repair protein RadA, partial [Corynebacterium casei]
KMVVIGEVGLAGELRHVPNIDRRLSEAARLGYTHAIVPAGGKSEVTSMNIAYASTLGQAIAIINK